MSGRREIRSVFIQVTILVVCAGQFKILAVMHEVPSREVNIQSKHITSMLSQQDLTVQHLSRIWGKRDQSTHVYVVEGVSSKSICNVKADPHESFVMFAEPLYLMPHCQILNKALKALCLGSE